MSDDEPTIEELQAKIQVLETELEELAAEVHRVQKIAKACEDMGKKLADKFGEPIADWWWPH